LDPLWVQQGTHVAHLWRNLGDSTLPIAYQALTWKNHAKNTQKTGKKTSQALIFYNLLSFSKL
jgi:hypothetical protein